MALQKNKITTCLWFDGQAEEAAEYYTSIFPNSKITQKSHYMEAGREYHGREPESVMTVTFELDGHPFVGLNGGPHFKFSPATSFQVDCKDQTEVDHFWSKLGEGGDESQQQCGWLMDKFGVCKSTVLGFDWSSNDSLHIGFDVEYVPHSYANIQVAWQVVPSAMLEMVLDENKQKVASMTNAMMKMKKLDIDALKAAFDAGA